MNCAKILGVLEVLAAHILVKVVYTKNKGVLEIFARLGTQSWR